MSATIRFSSELEATLTDSGKWRCKDKLMRQILNDFYPVEYDTVMCPDAIGKTAEKAAKDFGATVIRRDPPPPCDINEIV